MAKVQINVLEHQAKFIQSDAKHTALIGGYGSGKTQGGILKVVLKKMKLPEPMVYVKPSPISEYQEVLPLPENKDYINGGKKLPHKRKRR